MNVKVQEYKSTRVQKYKNIGLFYSFILVLFYLFAPQAQATVYQVKKTGNDSVCANATNGTGVLTIDKARQCLEADHGSAIGNGAGHIIEVFAGTYDENNPLSFFPPSGTSWAAPFTFRAASGNTVTVRSTSGNFHQAGGYSGRFILIDSIIFDGNNMTGNDPQISLNGADVKFLNVEIINTQRNAMIGGTRIELDRVKIHGGPFLFPGGSGGDYAYAYYITGDDVVIHDSEFYDMPSWSLHINCTGCPTQPQRTKIYNNQFHNVAKTDTRAAAIIVNHGQNAQIYNNIIWDSGACIQTVSSTPTATINSNTCYGSLRMGLELNDTATVRNNIFMNNAGGNLANLGGSSLPVNNLCSTVGATTNCQITGLASDTFIAPGSDFHLKAGSPAISGGAILASPYNVDIAGLARPQGTGWDLGAYEYTGDIPAVGPQQLVLALPLDEGTGGIAVDVSGQKNNANLIGGATWDNVGVYGKAIMFDGTGYLNIAASASLALAPAMTLEAWVYPTVAPAGFTTVIRQARYFLYASSDAGYCPAVALAPLGGYATTVNNAICATSLPPLNQWSHLAVTYDGSTMTFYLNGNIIASQGSPDPMVPSTYNVTIGASQFGENFVGKMDQPMVYNYARTRPQILSDMSTPLIGAPGKYVEIAAPLSVEISAASSIEIAAD